MKNWQYSLAGSSSLIPSQWQSVDPQNLPRAGRLYQGYIHYRAEFNFNSDTASEPLGIFLGHVGDVDAVYINGNLIGKTGEFPPQYSYSMDVVREYVIPPIFLRSGANEVYILTYVEYLTHKGININKVLIGPHRKLSEARYFGELSARLPRFVIPILCLLLALLSLPWVSQRNKRAQILLFLLAVDAFAFGICRSRINMHLFDLLTAYKIHILTALCAFVFLGLYSLEISAIRSRRIRWIAAFIPIFFGVIILPQKSVVDAAVIFDKWFYVETALILSMTTIVWLFAGKENFWTAIAFTFLSGTVLNDVFVDWQVYRFGRLLDIGFGLFIISMIVSQVTNIKRQLIRASQKELDFAWNQRVIKQASQVAHDLRSPLSSIQASLQFFREMFHEPKQNEAQYLNMLELSIARLNRIAAGLLEEQGQKQNGRTIFSLHKVLDELIGEYSSLAIGEKVAFRKEFDAAISAVGDRGKIQRAFGNIIKNAVEAIGKSGEISLNTRLEGGFSVVSIADSGPGMDGEKLSRVLKGGYSEGKADGHGIGMSVAREVVEEHGGKLEAESRLGQGTVFRIRLPIPSSKDFGTVSKVEEGAGTFELECFSGEPVVVIEDQDSVRLQWELILREQEKQATTFKSYEAFRRVSHDTNKSRTAVVDYDLGEGRLDGLEVIERLKREGFIRLYLCTAEYWKPVIQQQARELGVPIIPKPIPKVVVKEKADEEGQYKVLVIDDDELIGLTWKTLKKQMKIRDLHFFRSLEKFQESGIDPASLDIAFVDKNIEGSEFPGEQVMQYLREKKLPRVIQASGETGLKIPESIETFLT